MKKLSFYYASTMFIIVLFACCKTQEIDKPDPIIVQPKPIDTTKITEPRIIWKCRIHEDSSSGGLNGTTMHIYKDNLIFSDDFVKNNTDATAIKAIDIKTAKLSWSWEGFRHSLVGDYYTFGNKGAYVANSDVEVLDLDTGKNIWSTNNAHLSGAYEIQGYKNDLYHIGYNNDECSILKTDFNTQNWENIYTNKIDGKVNIDMCTLTVGFNEKGERILYVQNRTNIVGKVTTGYVRVLAYNETLKKMEWKSDSLDSNSAKYPPVVSKGKLYIYGDSQAICLDVKTGVVLWKTKLRQFGLCGLLLEEDRLYFKSVDQSMFCISAETGKIIWSNFDNDSFACINPTYHKGKIYYSSWSRARLESVDAATGKVLWSYKSPFSRGQFSYAIAIDHEKNLMFASDGYQVFCFQLPN